MNLLIIGYARHGKTTAAKILKRERGFKFIDSSRAAAQIFLYNKLKEKYGYGNFEECYEDRINHRREWFDEICEFNKEDPARLAKEIMKDADIYCGMRSNREIQKCIDNRIVNYDHQADKIESEKYGASYKLEIMKDDLLPKYLVSNKEKYKDWFDNLDD